MLLGAAWKESEKTNNTLIFFLSLSLMRDSLTVLSESTEYPLRKKQAIQTEYMITHCLEGIQGPSCACINSSSSATANLANAKSLYEMRLVKPWKEYEYVFASLLWTPEKCFPRGWSSARALGLFSPGLQMEKGWAATVGRQQTVSLGRVRLCGSPRSRSTNPHRTVTATSANGAQSHCYCTGTRGGKGEGWSFSSS